MARKITAFFLALFFVGGFFAAVFFGVKFARTGTQADGGRFSVPTVYAPPPRIPFNVSAKHAVLIDGNDLAPLLGKLEEVRAPEASTTKIMTALVALEHTADLDRKFRVNDKAVGVEGSSIYLKRGEEINMRDLLYALLLESANDAAAAIAYEVGGSIEGFAAMMNARAAELGLTNTHFTNPHGLDNPDHYTTAYELAVIAAAALRNEEFAKIDAAKEYTMTTSEGVKRYFKNHNKMLWNYPDAVGVKTGYTKKDGRTLVSAARRGDQIFIAVTLNASDDWNDHTKLLDWAFAHYERVSVDKDKLYTVPMTGGEVDTITLMPEYGYSARFERGMTPEIAVELPQFVYAPIKKGERAGAIILRRGDEVIAEIPLVAAQDYNKGK